MKPLSIRTRLLLWNTVVLAVAWLILAFTLRGTIEDRIIRTMDRHLTVYADGLLASSRPPAPRPRLAALAPEHGELPHSAMTVRLLDAEGRDFHTGAAGGNLDAGAFAAALRGHDGCVTVERPGEELRVLFRGLEREGRRGVLQISVPLSEHRRLVWHLTHALVAHTPVLLLIAGIGGALVTERSLRPVRKITEAAGRIEVSSLSDRLPVIGRDELSHLSGMLNGMLDRLQCAFEQQRRFTADASHELRTPIAVIKAITSLRLEDDLSAEDREAYAAIGRAADRTQRIVSDLLLLARADGDRLPLQVQDVEAGEWIAQALDALPQPPAATIRLDLEASPLVVRGDPEHLLRLLVNLLENADRHTPEGGTITLRASRFPTGIRIVVEDTGEGIPAEHLPHICERFYRVDAGRERTAGGSGLGLAICRTIAEAHGGTLEVESTLGKGTTVTAMLPEGGSAPSSHGG